MRLAVISDIHANLEAFKQVLADISRSDVARVISLGDTAGYGPEPEEVVSQIRDEGITTIVGNHELGLLNEDAEEGFNPLALESLMLTRTHLSRDSIAYLKTLAVNLSVEGGLFVHGCPPDSATTYVHHLEDHELIEAFRNTPQRFSFTGHTHMLNILTYDGNTLDEYEPGEGEMTLHEELRYIINVGSVGQPRDWDPRAKYVIWDTETFSLDVRYVEYDIAVTVEKMARRGFLKKHADLPLGPPASLPFLKIIRRPSAAPTPISSPLSSHHPQQDAFLPVDARPDGTPTFN